MVKRGRKGRPEGGNYYLLNKTQFAFLLSSLAVPIISAICLVEDEMVMMDGWRRRGTETVSETHKNEITEFNRMSIKLERRWP